MNVTSYILLRTCKSESLAKIMRLPVISVYPSVLYPIEPLILLNASVELKSTILTGCLPCVPNPNNFVPALNSKTGRLALNSLFSTATVLLYAALALITSTWNQRLERVHAFKSGLARLIVR